MIRRHLGQCWRYAWFVTAYLTSDWAIKLRRVLGASGGDFGTVPSYPRASLRLIICYKCECIRVIKASAVITCNWAV